MNKSFWKTFIVDLFVLFLIFWLFIFSKGYVGNFLEDVNSIDLDIEEAEAELDNQTTEQIETFVEDYEFSIWWFYIFMMFIIPLIGFLLIFGSQAFNIAIIKKSFNKFLLNLVYCLPILLILFILISYFIENFYLVLSDFKIILVLGFLILLLFIMSYVWLGIVCGDYKKFLKKFYLFLPLYILLVLLFSFSLIVIGYLAALYMVDGLLPTEFLRYFLLVCVLLVGVQFLRGYIVKKVS